MKSFPKIQALAWCFLLVFLFLSCETEMIAPALDAEEPLSFRDVRPNPEEDCKCYMRVVRTENAGLKLLWAVLDFTNAPWPSTQLIVEGTEQFWKEVGIGLHPLPSPFELLNAPHHGWHEIGIYYTASPDASPAPIIDTEVRCYLQNTDGSETLMTTTHHRFQLINQTGDGVWDDTDGVYKFNRQFSCLVLPPGPGQDPIENPSN